MVSNREQAMIEECEYYRDECARLRDLLEDRKYVVADALDCLADLRRAQELLLGVFVSLQKVQGYVRGEET